MRELDITALDAPVHRERAFLTILGVMKWPRPLDGMRRWALLLEAEHPRTRRVRRLSMRELTSKLGDACDSWIVVGRVLRIAFSLGSLQGGAVVLEREREMKGVKDHAGPRHADQFEQTFRRYRDAAHLCAAFAELPHRSSAVPERLEWMHGHLEGFLKRADEYQYAGLYYLPRRRRRFLLGPEVWSVPLRFSSDRLFPWDDEPGPYLLAAGEKRAHRELRRSRRRHFGGA